MSAKTVPQPAPRRILQIAYYESLLRTRAEMLQRSGYHVASVLGNHQAKSAAPQLVPGTDLVMVGFSGSHADRTAITRWLKQQYPRVKVVVLQAHSSERFPDADCATLSEDPEIWMGAIADCLANHPGRA